MKIFTCFSPFLIVLFFCKISLAQTTIMEQIIVSNNVFLNESGDTMIFHGLNASDPDNLEKIGQWKQSYFDEMKKWGANMVRFPIHPKAWRERGVLAYLELLDKGISMAEKAGLYVIIDWHSIGNIKTELFLNDNYFTTKTETFRFWKIMAEKYGQKSSVAFFELFNEPTTNEERFGTISWQEWKEFNEEIIRIIRANGAKNIPLVAGFNWAYDLTEIENHSIEADGVAYVSHPYPQKREKPWEEKWEEDWGFLSEKYPLVLTEIGFCEPGTKGAHIPVMDDGSYVDAITNYSAMKGISYVVWVFDTDWSPMLIEDWNYNPTKAGALWKSKMIQSKK